MLKYPGEMCGCDVAMGVVGREGWVWCPGKGAVFRGWREGANGKDVGKLWWCFIILDQVHNVTMMEFSN